MMEPKIRFKGFEGEWKTSTIGDFTTSFSGGTPTAGASEFYGGNIPFIRSGEIHESKTELFLTEAGLNNSSAKVVEKGTLLYALYGATSGEVGISKIKGAINQAILAIYPNKTVDKRFLANYLQSHKEKIVGELLQGGQGNLSGALVKSISVTYPNNREQQTISDYVDSLDSQISASTSRLASLKQMKAASLQAMFPQEGETVPKIRFQNNRWQKYKVGDLCDLLTGYPFPGDKILTKGKDLLMRGINITEGSIRHSNEIDRYYNEDTIGLEKYRLQVGDLVIGMDGSKVGKNSALVTSKEKNSLLVQRVARLRNEDKNLIKLIQIAVGSDNFIKYVEEMKTSSAIPHISPADIRNFPLSLPEDSNERRQIASYFTSLDRQISLQSQRLEKLKQIKSACLDKMFV